MDLIPKPDQVVSAAGNLAHRWSTAAWPTSGRCRARSSTTAPLREVYHYRPAAGVHAQGDPVLLVTPLAAPAICYDLRRGCSLVEHLVEIGRPTYLVEYGAVSFRDRNLGMEHWIEEVVPTAIREVSAHAGGRPVHVVGWSLGGVFALLAAAGDPTCRSRSITVVGLAVRRPRGAAGGTAAAAAQLHRRARRDHPALPGRRAARRSRWCAGRSSCRRSRSW